MKWPVGTYSALSDPGLDQVTEPPRPTSLASSVECSGHAQGGLKALSVIHADDRCWPAGLEAGVGAAHSLAFGYLH